jgi:hypothetical protein
MMEATASNSGFGGIVRKTLKGIVLMLISFIALVAVTLFTFWFYTYITYEVPKSKIEVTVSVGTDMCTAYPEYPVFVGFVNHSDRTINAIRFRLEARIRGRSTNVLSASSLDWNRDDHIIKPKEGFGNCWRPIWSYDYKDRGLKPMELDWRMGEFTVTFTE